MRTFNVEQRSEQWYSLRTGVVTASNFSKCRDVLKNGNPGSKYITYRDDLVTERITGDLTEYFTNWQMKRGMELEPAARSDYERASGNMVEEVGFVMLDEFAIGCSPDGLVGSLGMVEIKCPASGREMAEAWLDWDKFFADYEDQVRGQLWLCERAWCDVAVYHPKFPLLVKRINAEGEKEKALADSVMKFEAEVTARTASMRDAFKEMK